jgi:hypothetical protein
MSCLLVFNRVYRLEIQLVMLVFSTPVVNNRPSNLLTGSSTPLPFPVWISTMVHVFIQCIKGGGGEKPTFRVWCLYRYLVHDPSRSTTLILCAVLPVHGLRHELSRELQPHRPQEASTPGRQTSSVSVVGGGGCFFCRLEFLCRS